jgi:outer membrane protein assembly factor BamE (lipoprotein component of BamABCDE complex)
MKAWLWLLPLALLAGCSTPQSRSKEKQAAFDHMSAKQKTAVLDGKVEPGMSKDAVYIAFGKPDRVSKDGGAEKWIFTKPEFYDIPHWRYRSVQRADGRMSTIPEYDPLQMKRYVDDLEVTFKNGKVAGWKKL